MTSVFGADSGNGDVSPAALRPAGRDRGWARLMPPVRGAVLRVVIRRENVSNLDAIHAAV